MVLESETLRLCLLFVIAIVMFKLYQVLSCGVCRCTARLEGKVAIVTGSDRGIGYATAEELARRGARVILACVDDAMAKRAQDSIVAATGNPHVRYLHLDLASFASVRAFAAGVLASEGRLDVLVNNAGVFCQGQKRTPDALIAEAQINYFGPFLLTNLLLPLLEVSAPSRIVNVASVMHVVGSCDFFELDRKSDSDWILYAHTKMCLVMFTNELSRRLSGTGVVANSLHPGLVRSDFYNSAHVALQWFSVLYNNLFFKSEREGAQTSLHLAVAPECETVSGRYFMDCKPKRCSPIANDWNKAKKLWELTEKTVNIDTMYPNGNI